MNNIPPSYIIHNTLYPNVGSTHPPLCNAHLPETLHRTEVGNIEQRFS